MHKLWAYDNKTVLKNNSSSQVPPKPENNSFERNMTTKFPPQKRVWFITGKFTIFSFFQYEKLILKLNPAGASSGLGYWLTLEALSRGDFVIATARSLSRLEDLKKKGACTMELDVTDDFKIIQQKSKEATAIYGRIDVLGKNMNPTHTQKY